MKFMNPLQLMSLPCTVNTDTNSPKVLHDSIQISSHFVECITVGVLLRDAELSDVMECFVVAIVVGVLLSDLCVVDGFIDINILFGARVLLSKTESLSDSTVVVEKNEPTELLVIPVLKISRQVITHGWMWDIINQMSLSMNVYGMITHSLG